MKNLLITLLGCLLVQNAFAQEVDDERITEQVSSAIENNADLDGSDILVVSVNGWVILAGQVLSDDQKQQASVTAGFASRAIRRLINELQVVDALDHSFDDSDRLILDQIVAVIPGMSPATIPIIHNGTVHLMGQVTRAKGKEVATTISRMDGVKFIRISYEYTD